MITFGSGNLRVPKLSRKVYLVGAGMTDFRKFYPEKQSSELCLEAMKMAVDGTKVSVEEFHGMANYAVYPQFADHFGDQLLAEAKINDYLGLDPIGNVGVKTGGATGGTGAMVGIMAVASGYASVAPVIGLGRMGRSEEHTR